jgi:N-acyl-D-amino-acid deacylase
MQGVTTEITGNDGDSKAPLKGAAREYVGIPGVEDPPWESFGEYLDYLETPGLSVNVASLVGLNTLRLCVVGPELRRVHKNELEQMKKLVAKCMKEGAWGMSSGLVYFPGAYSDTYELIELCKIVAEHGGIYTSHQRGERDQNIEAERETYAIGEYAGIRVHSSHQSAKLGMWGRANEFTALRVEANKRGITWTCDLDIGELTNVDNATGMLHLEYMPTRTFGHGLSKEEIVSIYKNPEKRKWVKKLLFNDWPPGMGSLGPYKNRRFDLMRVIQSGNKEYLGKTIEAVAKMRGDEDPLDTLFDIYLEEGDRFIFHSQTVNDDDIKTILRDDPFVMICSDAGAMKARAGGPYVGQPRAFNTFPMVFHKYVRGDPEPDHAWFSKPQKILTLEEAVRKMTSYPAHTFRITNRGIIRKGMRADITIFDEETISSEATIFNTDVYPTGIPYVIVNGKIAKDNGKHTSVLAGKVLRWRIKAVGG